MFFFSEESADWPLEKFRVKYGVLVSQPGQMIYDDKRGKARWISKSTRGFATPSGNMTREDWRQQVLTIIKENGMEDLLEQIKQHCRTHCAWLKKEKEEEIELYAMECMASKAFEAWEDFRR